MGFWSRWFGGERETDAQKLDRARQHLDDGEPKLALAIVERIAGPEADEVRTRARAVEDGLVTRAEVRPERSIAPDGEDLRRGSVDDSEPRPAKQSRPPGDPYRDPARQPKQKKQPKPPKPAPGDLQIQFGADGSTTFVTGDGALTLNAPNTRISARTPSATAIAFAPGA